jgi:hypothetical protein
MRTNVKLTTTIKARFSKSQIAKAVASAPKHAVADPDNPETPPGFWDNAIRADSLEEIQRQLAQRKRRQGERGPQRAPTKVAITVRLSRNNLQGG